MAGTLTWQNERYHPELAGIEVDWVVAFDTISQMDYADFGVGRLWLPTGDQLVDHQREVKDYNHE